MPDPLPASEFGGKVRKNRTQPFPHEPTASEKLMLQYTTGDTSGVYDPDEGDAFNGLLPASKQEKLMRDAGLLEKGEVWDEFQNLPQPQPEIER